MQKRGGLGRYFIFLFFVLAVTGLFFVSGQNALNSSNNNSAGSNPIEAPCTNDDTRKCGTTDVGACKYGTQTCVNGEWGRCIGNIEATKEICNDNINNDCDEGIVGNATGGTDCKDSDCSEDSACSAVGGIKRPVDVDCEIKKAFWGDEFTARGLKTAFVVEG